MYHKKLKLQQMVTFELIHPLIDVHLYKNLTCIPPLRTSCDLD